MENPIEQRKRMVQDRIEKSFTDGLNVSEEIEKASHGVYEDNAENRRKNRVGQEYGHAAQQKEPTGKTAGADKTVDEHAAEASDKALERAAADKNAKPEVREAAQKELENRGSQEKKPAATAKKSKSSGGGDDGGKKDETSDIINDQGYENEDNTIVKRRNELRSKLKNGGKWDGLNEEENKEYEELGKTIRNARIQWGNNQEKKEKQRLREETENQGKGKIDFEKLGNRGNIATFKFERGYKDDGEDHILRIMNTYGKKDIKQDLDTLNEKLGTDLKLEDFKKRGGEWYGNRFEVFFNTETGEVDANIRKEWKKDKPFKEYNKYSAEELLGGYYTYLNGKGEYDHKKIKSELKDIVEKHGALKVAKSFVKNAIGAETLDGNSVQNKDEAKCEISNIFKEWGIKTDEETKKFLEYNPDNVWWL